MDNPRLLSRKEACEYLHTQYNIKRTTATLAKYVVFGGGPTYRKFGKTVYYTPAEIDQWVTDMLGPRMESTGEIAAPSS